MIFDIFDSVKSAHGRVCTYQEYTLLAYQSSVIDIHKRIAALDGANKEEINQLKKQLPVITWQASFGGGSRKNENAVASGLFMLDIDHVENPWEMYCGKIAPRIDALGIVFVSKTSSGKGLRIVAKCSIQDSLGANQHWLATELGVEYDEVCKDFARASYVTPADYCYYLDAKGIWTEEAKIIPTIDGRGDYVVEHVDEAESDNQANENGEEDGYNGIPYAAIIEGWFAERGGAPVEGERNARLFELATRLRYITDFNKAKMLRIMPTYGLSREEVESLVKSALGSPRKMSIPRDFEATIERVKRELEVSTNEEGMDLEGTEELKMPKTLPPIFREINKIAPDGFREAAVLCQLPILGTLGSRLRAVYLDGRKHSPSFQVSLEAPQASGKSFMTRLAEFELKQVIEHDTAEREKELEYEKKVRDLKLMQVKVDMKNKEEILGTRPEPLIRYCSPKMSITKLLIRMKNARGLHLFAIAPEIDTVTKTFKSGFANYSDLLRIAFDNDITGQDYATDTSFSGQVAVYYNTLFSGTPLAMRRFYPDVEDGLVSRVVFCTLPDQFGKPIPKWGELSQKQLSDINLHLVRLNEVSVVGDEPMPERMLNMDWLNDRMNEWLREQQRIAVLTEDRTRDTFCRRSAVVGFRAGMLAYFLWEEKPITRKHVVAFATWVADYMLRQQLLRFNLTAGSNTIPWKHVYDALGDEFSRLDVMRELNLKGCRTTVKVCIYKWRMAGLVEVLDEGKAERGKMQAVRFRKIKK